nr:hypothetical protein GY45DRAFT_1431817 [Cubamyces sp. BRFM 1775]
MTIHFTRTEDGVSKLKDTRVASTKLDKCVVPMRRPFDCIPVEILTQIFEYATEFKEMDSPVGVDIRRYGYYYLQTCVTSFSLGSIMRVCCHWRAVALNTPDLWRRVDVYGHVEPLAAALSRSRNKTIDVSLHRVSGAQLALPLLAAHSHRLRKLSLHWLDDIKDNGELCQLCQDLMDQVVRMEFPALEELLVDDGETYSLGEVYGLDLYLDPDWLPSLRIVRLDTVYVSWNSMIFSQLRVLHLQEVAVPGEEEISLSTFLDVLAECQSLEELTLVLAFPLAFPNFQRGSIPEGPFAGPVVELPKLRLLHLEWDSVWRTPCETYQILQHLRLQPQATVRIVVEYDRTTDPTKSLLDVVPRDPTCLPILTAGTSVQVFVAERDFTQFAVGSTPESREFALLLANNSSRDWPQRYGVDQQLRDFCTLFADAPVTHLSIDTDGFGAAGLQPSFCLLRHLTTIQVNFEALDALKQLLDAIASSPSPSPSPPSASSAGPEETPSDADDTCNVVVPQLRTLKLKTLPWHLELLSDIERCLQWRFERGTELEELYIEVYGREKDTEGEVEMELRHTTQLVALQMQVNGSVVFVDAPRPS